MVVQRVQRGVRVRFLQNQDLSPKQNDGG